VVGRGKLLEARRNALGNTDVQGHDLLLHARSVSRHGD
jgi:hypothetical protein